MEIAIVGAGPAGSLCGARLAAVGHRVTLFDASHPREKPCGGGVTPGAFDRHPELAAAALLGREADHVELRSGERSLRVRLPRPIRVFARRSLDACLLDQAIARGAKLRAERVRNVALCVDGVELRHDTGAEGFDFVVGADGAGSIVRRRVLGVRAAEGVGYATAGLYVKGLPERELRIEFLADVAGYLWVFPRPDHASVGIAAPLGGQGGGALRARVRDWLVSRFPGAEALPACPYAASIPCPAPAAARRAPIAGPRFALVGDAARQNDAITGEGIAHALDAAALLARALHAHGPLGAARAYTREFWRGPGCELAIASRWAARWYRPRSVHALIGLAGRHDFARRVMADQLAMEQPYRGLARRVLGEALASLPAGAR